MIKDIKDEVKKIEEKEKLNNKVNFAFLGIVAIVGIVAIIGLVSNFGRGSSNSAVSPQTVSVNPNDGSWDLAGQATYRSAASLACDYWRSYVLSVCNGENYAQDSLCIYARE